MDEIKESIYNGQWEQAISKIQDSKLDVATVLQEISKDRSMTGDEWRLLRVMISSGYLQINPTYNL